MTTPQNAGAQPAPAGQPQEAANADAQEGGKCELCRGLGHHPMGKRMTCPLCHGTGRTSTASSSAVQPAPAGQPQIVAYFKRNSDFGPWVEVDPGVEGAIPFCHATSAVQPQPGDVQALRRELGKASVGACNCGADSPLRQNHAYACRYRALDTAMEYVDMATASGTVQPAPQAAGTPSPFEGGSNFMVSMDSLLRHAEAFGNGDISTKVVRDFILQFQPSPTGPQAAGNAGEINGKSASQWYVAYCEVSEKLKAADGCIERYTKLIEERRPAATQAAPDLSDAEFLSKRLARVAKLAGVSMPEMTHEQIAGVAGTILGQIAGALERVQAAPVPEGWISVTERLPDVKPEQMGRFLVACRRAHNGKTYVLEACYLNAYPLCSTNDEDEEVPFTGWYQNKEHADYDDFYAPINTGGDEVTHWMPLPAAPAAQGEPT
jgi:hypothetical protein